MAVVEASLDAEPYELGATALEIALDEGRVAVAAVESGIEVETVDPTEALSGVVDAAAAEVADADSELTAEDAEADAADASDDWEATAEDSAEASDAETEASTEDCDAATEDSTEDSEAKIEDAAVVTGTGMTMVSDEPLDVLSVYAEVELVVTGTGTTDTPDEPDTVLKVYD